MVDSDDEDAPEGQRGGHHHQEEEEEDGDDEAPIFSSSGMKARRAAQAAAAKPDMVSSQPRFLVGWHGANPRSGRLSRPLMRHHIKALLPPCPLPSPFSAPDTILAALSRRAVRGGHGEPAGRRPPGGLLGSGS